VIVRLMQLRQRESPGVAEPHIWYGLIFMMQPLAKALSQPPPARGFADLRPYSPRSVHSSRPRTGRPEADRGSQQCTVVGFAQERGADRNRQG